MALGTITVKKRGGDISSAPLRADKISFAGDSTYPAGGTAGIKALVSAKLGINVDVIDVIGFGGQYVLKYDDTNDKLQVFDGGSATWAEATPGDLSAVAFQALVISK
jgi:hypothetical protein